jgi:UDP-glucose 4-epimerase
MPNILVTGANGFIGKSLCDFLVETDVNVFACVRDSKKDTRDKNISIISVGNIDRNTQWSHALEGVSVVVHLAARVHVMDKKQTNCPLDLYRELNVKGTENLAIQAAKSGVKRFVYISSIKVNGEQSSTPFYADDPVKPNDPYAISKWEAEQKLTEISAATGMGIVIIRPPLVYGPDVKGNFLRLMQWIDKGFPIPLANINNKRSLVNVDNLCDLVKLCIEHPNASGQVFLVSDARDLSSSELITIIAKQKQKPSRLVPVPVWLLNFVGRILDKSQEIERLCSSLQVNIQKNKDLLNWSPPWSVEDGVRKAVEYQEQQRKR